MSFWRYLALKMVVSAVVFIAMLPVFFISVGLFGRLLSTDSPSIFVVFPGVPILIGGLLATHLITEKLSKRWSR